MAIAFNAAVDGGNNGGLNSLLSWNHTVSAGANPALVIGVAGDTSVDDVQLPTFNGISATLLAKQTTLFTNNRKSYLFLVLGPTSGTHTVQVTCTGTHYLLGGSADYTGVAQSGQPDASLAEIGANSNITTFTSSLTTVADNCWTVLFENGYANNAGPSAGAGLTSRATDAALGTWGLFDSNAAVHPAGAYSMTTTRIGNASNSIIHVKASLVPAGAAAAWTPVNRIQRNWLRR